MNIQGILKEVLDLESGTSDKGAWQKQGFTIETIEKYPKIVYVTAFGKSLAHLDKCKVGGGITVDVNIESRKPNDNWFTNITAWRIVGEEATPKVPEGDLPF
tara:strand:+ start:362 stop:667 length:306 start_codon:yes stop_codon:yes gene_type:complete